MSEIAKIETIFHVEIGMFKKYFSCASSLLEYSSKSCLCNVH